jgi:hypothetical protein
MANTTLEAIPNLRNAKSRNHWLFSSLLFSGSLYATGIALMELVYNAYFSGDHVQATLTLVSMLYRTDGIEVSVSRRILIYVDAWGWRVLPVEWYNLWTLLWVAGPACIPQLFYQPSFQFPFHFTLQIASNNLRSILNSQSKPSCSRSPLV